MIRAHATDRIEPRHVAMVTGAGQGIGRATAVELAAHGYDLVLSDLASGLVEITADEVKKSGADCVVLELDVTDTESITRGVVSSIERYGRLDLLVNNAGTHVPGTVMELDEAGWERVMATNFTGTVRCSRAVLPYMIDQHSGNIVNVASVWAWACGAGAAPYCSSKAAVVAFTKSLAHEVGRLGIRVNAVAPALVDTDLYRSTTTEESRAAQRAECPMGRECTPEEIARPIRFLASDDASWIHGETIAISGGLNLR